MAQAAVADIPRLIAELRDHIIRKTGKPIDPDVDFLTTQIEVLSMVRPLELGWQGLDFTPSERRIMDTLASRKTMPFSRDALMNALYFDRTKDEPDVKIVDVYICRIRSKLVAADAQVWVESEHSLGFRLIDKPARLAQQEIKAPKETPERRSFNVLWRDQIILGRKQAMIADSLYRHMGEWVKSADIARESMSAVCALHEQISWIRRRLIGTQYEIEHRMGYGFRMVRRCSEAT